MNMFTLWIGPYHLDFKLELEKSRNCRISFNFKISQGIHFKIDNTFTEMIPITPKFVEDSFAFKMEAIVS
jgi:hypothetical protein